MTKREAAEKIIVQNGGCGGILCKNCPIYTFCEESADERGALEEYPEFKIAAKQWLEDHKEKQMTKTERIEEMERQLSALKAEVKEEEVTYPYVYKCYGHFFVALKNRVSYNLSTGKFDSSDLDFMKNEIELPISIKFKNGKPV